MNKKGIGLVSKILVFVIAFITLIAGIDFLVIAIVKNSFISRIFVPILGVSFLFFILGISAIVTSVILAIKTFKE
jgi:hypothetical protein